MKWIDDNSKNIFRKDAKDAKRNRVFIEITFASFASFASLRREIILGIIFRAFKNRIMLSKESLDQVKREVAKYPPERKSSAVMAALRIAQEEHGWLAVPLMDYVAELLGMRPIQVYEVASFYSMYDLKPVGKHKVSVCTNISCMLCGSDAIVNTWNCGLG